MRYCVTVANLLETARLQVVSISVICCPIDWGECI